MLAAFNETYLQEFYHVASRKKTYWSLDKLQADLHTWHKKYGKSRPHSGKFCFGKASMQTLSDSISLADEKMLNQTIQTSACVA